MGLMQAIELVTDRQSKRPATAETVQLMEAATENRILIRRGGVDGNVIRISPSLNISAGDVVLFIRAFGCKLSPGLRTCALGSAGLTGA
jgi:4-aminobutyrate aminotransferase-like enzyme